MGLGCKHFGNDLKYMAYGLSRAGFRVLYFKLRIKAFRFGFKNLD